VSELPDGWVEAALGDVCDRPDKWDPRSEPGLEFEYVDIGSVDRQRIVTSKRLFGEAAPSRARQRIRAGDTVLSTVRTYLVSTARVPDELDGAIASTGFCVLRPTEAIDSKFLYYRVIASDFVNRLSRMQTGSSYPAVRDSDVLAQRVRLPPVAEQRRIVAAIEEQLSRLDAAKARLADVELRLTSLRKGVVNRAVEGRWTERRLGEVALTVRNGAFVSRPAAAPPGVPILRISAVRPMALNVDDVRFANVVPSEVESYFVSPGDLLFTRYSGNPAFVGACAVVPTTLPRRTLHPDKLIRVTLNRDVCLPEFVELAFASGKVRRKVEARLKTTAGQVGIAGSQLKTIAIPLPPLDEQARIVGEVQSALTALSSMTASSRYAGRKSTGLRASILAAAFRGELVPQDPNDEPASVLLERIAAERAAAPKPARRRRVSAGH
jgi:type I restriction enzyme S subunit